MGPSECLIYSVLEDVCTENGTQKLVIENPKTFFHGNVTIEKTTCEITPSESGGLVSIGLYETASLADVDNNISYKYKFTLRNVVTYTDNRGVEKTRNEDDVLGYAEIPDQIEVNLGDLVFTQTAGTNQ